MLSEKLTTRASGGRLFMVLMVVLALAVAFSMAFATDADAKKKKKKKKHRRHAPIGVVAPPNPYAQLLVSRGGLWFEYPDPQDGAFGFCQLYGFQTYYGRYGVAQKRIYFLTNGACDANRQGTPSFGQVWVVNGNLLTIQRPTGGIEQITLGTYDSGSDSLPISRSSTGRSSVWYGCASQNNPFFCT